MFDALKRIISTVLIVAIVHLPLALVGCAANEIHTRQEITVEDKTVSQDTVVE